MEEKLNQLAKSTFRSSFHLSKDLIDYTKKIGLAKIQSHAYDFIKNR